MKRVLSILLAATLVVSLTACLGDSGSSGSSDTTATTAAAAGAGEAANIDTDIEYPSLNLRMSTTVGEQSNATVVGKAYADAVEQASGGKIKITMYSSDQLSGGDMSKGVEMLVAGSVDCAFEPVDVMSVLDDSMYALSLPWTFNSYQEAEDSLKGAGGDYLKNALSAQGLECLGFIHNGFRQLTNNKRPVITPDDIKALKLRVPGGTVFVDFFSALGADPLSMSFSELYTALSQGTVDGQENGFDLIVSNAFYEVQKYITVWNYSYGAFALVFNKDTWDSFDENTKNLLTTLADEYCAIGNQNVVNNEEAQKQTCIDYGCEVTELTEDQIQAFKDLLGDYYASMKELYGAEACAAFGVE